MKRKQQAASKTGPRSILDSEPPKPRPGFLPFTLDVEPAGQPRMRRIGRGIHGCKYAPKASTELFFLYLDAIGESFHRAKRKPISQKDAAEDLVNLARDAVTFVGLLHGRGPELCREVASRLADWPVSADRTDPAWQRRAQSLIEDLKLGGAIEGFIRSARTANQNPIRRYATAIYDTLFQTRWRYKEADQRGYNRQGCPLWAVKTLDLPVFSKSNTRAWAVLGKEMLLEQYAGFMEDAVLKEQKFKWIRRAENRSKSGNPTRRAILNEAFDDFAKELRKLAPAENIWRGDW